MKRLALALVAATAFAAPVAAESMATLLPALSFPEEVVTSSTKDCQPETAACDLAE